METLGTILGTVTGIINLVCLILVWIKMFQHGQTVLAIVCIILTFCLIGAIITFIYGWVKHKEWNITNIMLIFTVSVLVGIVSNFMNPDQFGLQARLKGAAGQ
jgi:hypothetical protein